MCSCTSGMRSATSRVRVLAGRGRSDYLIARDLAIPRTTVQAWRRRSDPPRSVAARQRDWRPADESAYAYLLGAYLGDGHIVVRGRSAELCVYLDASYPAIVAEVKRAITSSYPGTAVRDRPRPGAVGLYTSGVDWTRAFPQHGPGKKHTRRIKLVGWQRQIASAHPRSLLRGLIHSDGARCINRFRTTLPSGRVATYAYPRYCFSNLSADIRGIFCEHCELLGIRWTQSNERNISVSERESVVALDAFVGPKE